MIPEAFFSKGVTKERLDFAKLYPRVFTNSTKLKELYLQTGLIDQADYDSQRDIVDLYFAELAESIRTALSNENLREQNQYVG